MLSRASITLLIVIGALAGAPVRAADPAAPAPKKGNTVTLNGGNKPSGVLTREQLRQCLKQQQSLKDDDAELVRLQGELDAQKAEIKRQRTEFDKQGAEMEAERATIDLTKAEAVDAFNAKLAQRSEVAKQQNAQIEDYNSKVPPLKAKFEAVDATRQKWQAECGNRTYDEIDYYAIQRGK